MLTIITVSLMLLSSFICGCMQEPGNNSTVPADFSENRIVFNDSYGNRIELPHTATRIAACQAAVIEMLISIGAADRIAGVDRGTFANYPNIMNKLSPDVKNIDGYPLNFETILTLNPDVIISGDWGPYSRYVSKDKIQTLNFTLINADCHRLENLNKDAYVLGELTGNREGARRYIEFNQKYMNLVESRLANLTDDEMLTIYETHGRGYDAVLSGYSPYNFIWDSLHVQNANEELNTNQPVVSREWILQKDPDIIFKGDYYASNDGNGRQGVSIVSIYNEFVSRPGYEKLKAVQANRVYSFNLDLINRPITVIGLVYFAKAIYPDRFADIDPDAVRLEYAQEFGFGDEIGLEWFYPPFEPVNATSREPTKFQTDESGDSG